MDEDEIRKEFYRLNGKTEEEEVHDQMGALVWVLAIWCVVAIGLIVYFW